MNVTDWREEEGGSGPETAREAREAEAGGRPPRRYGWQRALSMGLFGLALLLLGLYLWENREALLQMLRLSRETVAGMLLLALCGCAVNSLYHLVILQAFRLKLSLTDWMGVVCVSNVMATVLPLRAELLFTAAYYKRVKGLAYTKSVSMAAGNIVFGLAFSLLQILAALLCAGWLDKAWPGVIWAVWGLGAAGLAAFLALALAFGNRLPGFLNRFRLVRDIASGFLGLLQNRRMLWRLLGCLIAGNLIRLLLYLLCFRAIGIEARLYEALFFSSVSWLSEIVAIVPGNLGIRESIMGAAMLLFGALFQNGLAVSLVQRAAMLAAYLLLGLVFALPVYRRFTRAGRDAGAP